MRDLFKNRDPNIISGKKKNILLWSIVGILVLVLILSAVMSIDMKKALQIARSNNENAPDIEAMVDASGTKESWAISIENRLDAIAHENEEKTQEVSKKILKIVEKQTKKYTRDISDKMDAINKNLEKQFEVTTSLQKEIQANKLQQLSNIEALQEQITNTARKIDNVKMMPPPPLHTKGDNGEYIKQQLPSSDEDSIFSSLDITPVIKKVLRSENKLTYSVTTVKNSFVEKNATDTDNETLTNEEKEAQSTFEVVTGFTEAYMITGAYAPLFVNGGGRSSGGGGGLGRSSGGGGRMKAVPVLFETEGDLIMPNDTIGSIDKCMLIGTAIGNAASNTVDIRLEKMTCLIADGKKIIDGKISGWVVSETGTPGIPAKLIYRAGDYIARVIGSGVLEGLSQGFINAAAAGNYGGGSSSGMIYSGAVNGASSGVSNAFSKLADLYLSLAEQTLPILSVKGGRSVSMVLEGGDKFKMRDINLLDTREVEYYVDEFVGES